MEDIFVELGPALEYWRDVLDLERLDKSALGIADVTERSLKNRKRLAEQTKGIYLSSTSQPFSLFHCCHLLLARLFIEGCFFPNKNKLTKCDY